MLEEPVLLALVLTSVLVALVLAPVLLALVLPALVLVAPLLAPVLQAICYEHQCIASGTVTVLLAQCAMV